MKENNETIGIIIIPAIIAGITGSLVASDNAKSSLGENSELITESQDYQDLKDCAEKLKDNIELVNLEATPATNSYDDIVRALEEVEIDSYIPDECDMLD